MRILLLCIATLCVLSSPRAQDVTIKDPVLLNRLDTLNRLVNKIDLRLNRLYWEDFLARAEKLSIAIPIYACRPYSVSTLIDTVPHLKELSDKFWKIERELDKILNKDEEYRKVNLGYKYAATKEERAECQKVRQAIKAELYRNCPEYREVRKARELALKEQNIAAAWYLFNYCSERYEILETNDVIDSKTRNAIRQANQEIQMLENDKLVLTALISKIRREYINDNFNPEPATCKKSKVKNKGNNKLKETKGDVISPPMKRSWFLNRKK